MIDAEETMWWAGGILDGDGCVVIRQSGTVLVAIKQAAKGKLLLHHFQALFGGNVYRAGRTVSVRHQAPFQWELAGAAAKAFCLRIAPYTRLKRRQLELAATVPANPKGLACVRETQSQLRYALKDLKAQPHERIRDEVGVPYAYAAGLVDTDGSLDLEPTPRIIVTQKYPAIVDWFRETFGGGVYAYKNRAAHEWKVTGTKAVTVLERMAPYMLAKLEQARVILEDRAGWSPTTPPPAGESPAARLRALKGNQNKKRTSDHSQKS